MAPSFTHKLLSENPERYDDAVIQGMREVIAMQRAIHGDPDSGPEHSSLAPASLPPGPFPPIASLKMGTTVATNALLERKGEPTVLAITQGFEDALRIGYQERPDLFAHRIDLPALLHGRVIGVRERIDAHGAVLVPLDLDAVRLDLESAFHAGFRAIAIVLMHGYRYPEHERAVADIARELGFSQVSVSHEVSPLVKLIGRGDTTVVDAYLSPILRRYVEAVTGQLPHTRLLFMQSNGGLTDARRFRGRDSILSGPAGGVVGAVATAEEAGFHQIISFDMGGTSTDVAHYAGAYERAFETKVANVRMRVPIMRIHTVAAGGGSIARFRDGRFRVGPESAGANPGPACYRRGGPLTVTDCNLMVGKIVPRFFPAVFGPEGNLPIDEAVVRQRFSALAGEIDAHDNSALQSQTAEQRLREIADGFLRIAVENMANAIKKISIQRGYDVTEYTLCAFGAAGGQHACLVADALGMERIFLHAHAGVLSAYGMGLADIRALRERSIEAPLTESSIPRLVSLFDTLAMDARAELQGQGIDPDAIEIQRAVYLKYTGTDASLLVDFPDPADAPARMMADMIRQFEESHQSAYGFRMAGRGLVVEMISLEAIGHADAAPEASPSRWAASLGAPRSRAASSSAQAEIAPSSGSSPSDGPSPSDSPTAQKLSFRPEGEIFDPTSPQARKISPSGRDDRPFGTDDACTDDALIPDKKICGEDKTESIIERADFQGNLAGSAALQGGIQTDIGGVAGVERSEPPGILPSSLDAGMRGAHRLPKPSSEIDLYTSGQTFSAPVYQRESLPPGARIPGPALLVEPNATTVIEPEWRAEVTPQGDLLLTRAKPARRGAAIGTRADPVMLEVFNNLFMSIAEQMGAALVNTAYSVNIKERLDFSCALFDGEGHLVANAPHIPVHLGSMGDSVRAVLRSRKDTLRPGDVLALNNPYNGGTHLPDITVITPVFDPAGAIRFFVATRGHHADIGGITPGSMPPRSRNIHQEGVLIDDFLLVRVGQFREQAIRDLLERGGVAGVERSEPPVVERSELSVGWIAARIHKQNESRMGKAAQRRAHHPARNPDQNIADLKAQIAANAKGVRELQRMVDHYGPDVVHAYMGHVQDNAEAAVRRVLETLPDHGHFQYPFDDGTKIVVHITIDKTTRSAIIDFAGTSPQQPTNFNAPLAVCRAAVLYVFRTLVDEPIPLNEGCLRPLDIRAPKGSLLNPDYPAAVAAGNVETSQCITDALFGALGVLAAAQGTMNGLTFGNGRYQYYETICGGAGAGPGFDGASAVHTHMTNSRLTDPEILEQRFPVLLEKFAIRKGSGGAGRFRGGDGVVRRIRFLEPLSAGILSNHRKVSPFGMAGGEPGQVGRNWVERADGRCEELASTEEVSMEAGDVLVIETPGGGGWGEGKGEMVNLELGR
uniref:N-methylhydantoinase B/oxoprolinase/acetone carboxylase, alpha subunit n=1 Tax=Candidatus Kentrum sp. LPFa TaxID=2126335 RepID=A0A450W1A3_9GAMM|nr:MAG: N-methylhydantoinase B/oxoprolinase/acetone carboxylase, alpha subunit [Candidatus Kentron sp. LPFa]